MITLITALDKKVSKKFELIDEKFKKFEEEMSKLKNESMHSKTVLENSTKLLNQNKENIDFLLVSVDDFRNIIKIQSDNIEANFKKQQKKLDEMLVKNNELLNTNTLLSSNNVIKTIDNMTKSESSEKLDKESNKFDSRIKENSKRIENIESAIKIYNLSQMSESILKIKEILQTKSDNSDIQDIKGTLRNYYDLLRQN
jgi:hypothetical protein